MPDDGNASHARRSNLRQGVMDTFDDTEAADTAVDSEGYGAFVWKRVASAANTLTVNVSKAWAAGLFTEDGPGMRPFINF
jgi:hypothetical protein